jgi:hypothetical protein
METPRLGLIHATGCKHPRLRTLLSMAMDGKSNTHNKKITGNTKTWKYPLSMMHPNLKII